MNIADLKKCTWKANKLLFSSGVVIFTWGNVSVIDRKKGIMAIKPSGIEYHKILVDDIVILDLDGNVIDGNKKPSVDAPTHIEIYKSFSSVGSIVHTHSLFATAFAQANREITCFGTTHADYFYGNIPVTRKLHKSEVGEYEKNTGKVIVERFEKGEIDPEKIKACLVKNHGPFVWGEDANKAVENSIVLEQIAKSNFITCGLNSNPKILSKHIIDTHFLRKHGKNNYYGQEKK